MDGAIIPAMISLDLGSKNNATAPLALASSGLLMLINLGPCLTVAYTTGVSTAMATAISAGIVAE